MPLDVLDIIAAIVGSGIAEAVRKVDPKESVTVRSRVTNIAAGLAAGAYFPQFIWSAHPNLLQYHEATVFSVSFCGSSVLHYASGIVNDPSKWRELPIINKYFSKQSEGK